MVRDSCRSLSHSFIFYTSMAHKEHAKLDVCVLCLHNCIKYLRQPQSTRFQGTTRMITPPSLPLPLCVCTFQWFNKKWHVWTSTWLTFLCVNNDFWEKKIETKIHMPRVYANEYQIPSLLPLCLQKYESRKTMKNHWFECLTIRSLKWWLKPC